MGKTWPEGELCEDWKQGLRAWIGPGGVSDGFCSAEAPSWRSMHVDLSGLWGSVAARRHSSGAEVSMMLGTHPTLQVHSKENEKGALGS